MNRRRTVDLLVTILLVGWLAAAGCMTEAEWKRWADRNKGKGEQPVEARQNASQEASVRDTIAPLITLQGMRFNQVRGFGLVVDLVDTGGSDAPEVVRTHMIKEIRRKQDVGLAGLPALDILNSKDSAMVEITGYIPAGAVKGDRFDVLVRALGSEARSIAGGRLVLGDLRLYAETPSGVLSSKALATASGPVFVSPFDREGEPTDKVDLRRGVILGGGQVSESRKIRLVLNDPRHSVAKLVERTINGRYAGRDAAVATGESSAVIHLEIPSKMSGRKRLFIERVLHTSLLGNPTALRQRTATLLQEIEDPEANCDSIGLALEAIGKIALPEIRRLFEHDSPKVVYYAGRTALRLEDRDGLSIVADRANDAKSEFRMEAIDELGWAFSAGRMYAAGECLRKLLDDEATAVRIAAYRAISRKPHPAIATTVLDEDNLILDVIETSGPYLIYVQRSRSPRIALFGKNMRCKGPAMFPGGRKDGRRLLTQLSALPEAEHLSFVYTNKRTGVISPRIEAPMGVADLIHFLGGTPKLEEDKLIGYAVPYAEIVDILSAFCEADTIPAKLVLEGIEEDDEQDSGQRGESEF